MHGTSTTRISLLEVLRDQAGNEAAWGEFVRIYGPAVVDWCRARGLQHHDALDVTQEALLRFWRASKQFRYDPRGRFRSYLEQVARSALARWAEQGRDSHDQATRPLFESIPDREDLLARLAEAYDTELLAVAMAEVQARVKPRTWQAFQMLAIDRQRGAEVAAALGMEVSTVYVARWNVQRMIRETIDRLEGGAGGGADTIDSPAAAAPRAPRSRA